jgi:hypothetical protein
MIPFALTGYEIEGGTLSDSFGGINAFFILKYRNMMICCAA